MLCDCVTQGCGDHSPKYTYMMFIGTKYKLHTKVEENTSNKSQVLHQNYTASATPLQNTKEGYTKEGM